MEQNKYNYNSHSGRFNKRIVFFGPTTTQDEIGNEIESFGEISKVWSMVKTTKGSEYAAAAQTNSLMITRFVIRYSESLKTLFDTHKTTLEIHFKGSEYNIQSIINDDELNKTFTIVAEGKL